MKNWLKNLFRGDRFENVDENEEKPSDTGVNISHSTEKEKRNDFDRPNFRFPLEVDEKRIIVQEETKIEPISNQPKNYDFWQNQSNRFNQMNKEGNIPTPTPTYSSRNDLTSNSNNYRQKNFSTKQAPIGTPYKYKQNNGSFKLEQKTNPNNLLQENGSNKSEQNKSYNYQNPKPEEDKVDIVFRPIRKTPFRPSEYISPIYGYQKPNNSTGTTEELGKSSTGITRQNSQSYSSYRELNSSLQEYDRLRNMYFVQEINNDQNEEQKVDEIPINDSNVNEVETPNSKQQDYSKNEINELNQVNNLQLINEQEHLTTGNQLINENDKAVGSIEEVDYLSLNGQEEISESIEEVDHLSLNGQEEISESIEEVDHLSLNGQEEISESIEEVDHLPLNGKEISESIEEVDHLSLNGQEEISGSTEEIDHLSLNGQEEISESIEEVDHLSLNRQEEVSEYIEEVEHRSLNGQEEVTDSIEDEVNIPLGVQEEDTTTVEEIENLSLNEQAEETESIEVVENSTFTEVEVTEPIETVNHNKQEEVSDSIEVESSINEQIQISESKVDEEVTNDRSTSDTPSEAIGEVKREKKRHFPFNVLMLRSDVAAARKSNIMRQLHELQDEAAVSVEQVKEEVELDSKERAVEVANSSKVDEFVTSNPVESVNQINNNLEYQQEVIDVREEIEQALVKSEISAGVELPAVQLDKPIKPPALYELPELDLLIEPPMEQFNDGDWVEGQKQLLQETLHNFNVGAKVIAATQGPTVTRFEVQPEPGVKVNKITNLQDDIKLSLAARDIRIEAPIPGRSAIGIEVPNQESKPVYLRELVSEEKFLQSESPLTVALGLDIGGEPVYADIAKMPHGLIAGATGSGKSVCINSILVSILYKAKPHEVKLILIDPKMVELAPYNHIPHLISPVITDARAATAALKWACEEMDRRYDLFAHAGARDIKRFNDLARKKGAFNDELPYLVIIIDELADLMMVSPGDVETYICRIAQKARACGIHLLVATQRPSVDVITGIIKSNIPTRIAFTVSSQVDSRTIIDIGGAEKLLGRGDMLFLDNGKSQAIRLQGVYVSDDEIEHVVEIVKDQQKPNYLFNQDELVAKADAQDVDDELFEEAVEFVIDQKGASVSMLQRRFRIGYNRAARLVDLMYDHGIVSNQNGSKPRDILITLDEFRSEG